MVIHPPRRIKMGEGRMWKPQLHASALSPGKAEDQKECTVQLFGRFRVDAANNPPNAVATKRNQLVSHDLRSKAKTVLRCNFDQRPQRKSILHIRRDRTDEDCRKAGVEFVALNDDAGPRPPEIAPDDHQHHIASRYFHDSQS
jgi:hypothetical protein